MSWYLVLLVSALAVAAFAAAAETAIGSVSRLRIKTLAEQGDRRARVVEALQREPNGYLSTILSLNTVSVIVASTAATLYSIEALPRVSQFIVDAVLSVIALVVAEIAPKSLALRYNERASLTIAPLVAAVTRLLLPLIGGLTWVGTLPLRLLSGGAAPVGPFVTEEEIKQQIAEAEREGVVEQEEREMIHGVLELTDKVAREVMVPRVDVAGMEVTGTVDDVVKLIGEAGHSRIPVYDKTIDDIVGVAYAKDILRRLNQPGLTLRQLAREPYFTPEAKNAAELLHDMQVRKVHFAVVVDEYGGTAGIITIEDLLEEIVGEIRDEYDVAEQEQVQFLSDREVLVSARLSLDDVKEMLGLDIDTEQVDADSVGGLVYERLGEIPKPGATVKVGEMDLIVETVRRQSITIIRIVSPRPFEQESGGRRADVEEARNGVASGERDGDAGHAQGLDPSGAGGAEQTR